MAALMTEWRYASARTAVSPGYRSAPGLAKAAPGRVTIELDTGCLRRLLGAGQLHVEDFSCVEAESKECVRRLLLQSLITNRA